MEDAPETLLAGHYFLAVEGLALIRNWLYQPSDMRPMIEDVKAIVARLEDFPNSLEIPVTRHDVEAGYTKWAPRYDGPNPAIEVEEPIVRSIVGQLEPGVALDAACGTGRHAAMLADLGWHVIGVDATPAMLEVAKAKMAEADFRAGRLEALPVEDASVDVVTCALALTHVEELGPVINEFARVLKPGGRIVLSDIHPFNVFLGGGAVFPTGDEAITVNYVPNLLHPVSEYVTAFVGAGLAVRACVEPTITEAIAGGFPSFGVFPDATLKAYVGLPFLLIWELEKPA